jgi:hypothetical protein
LPCGEPEAVHERRELRVVLTRSQWAREQQRHPRPRPGRGQVRLIGAARRAECNGRGRNGQGRERGSRQASPRARPEEDVTAARRLQLVFLPDDRS